MWGTVAQRRPTLQAAASIAALFLLVGCGARAEYFASHLVVERIGWDSVRVDVTYAQRKVIGGGSPITADSTVVTLFDARYDTLYSGSPGAIPIPDAELGHRESIMIEACGTVKRRQICAQQSIESSPKRISLDEAISYPHAGSLAEGSYDLSFAVERRDFKGHGWEPIDAQGILGHILVWVEDPEAKNRGMVRIPFSRPNGRFNLSRYANFKNFKFYLDSELLDHQTAGVTFEIHAGLSGNPVRLAATTKVVRSKTQEDRENDVRYFAEQVAEIIIDELGSYPGNRSVAAYVDDWRYHSGSRTYRIELEIVWDGPRSDRGRHELMGILQVGEDGEDAVFVAESGNRRAVRKWRKRRDDDTFPLGRLGIYREDPIVSM